MKKLIQYAVLVGLLIVLGLMLKDYITPMIPRTPTPTERLKPDERQKVVITAGGDVARVERKKGKDGKEEQVAYRDTGARETQIIIKEDGTLQVTQKTKGLIFEPGVGIAFDREPLVTLDAQFYFVRNLGLVGGVAVPADSFRGDKLRLYVGGVYRLPFKAFRNTSVVAAYSTKRTVQVGIRVRF